MIDKLSICKEDTQEVEEGKGGGGGGAEGG